MTRTAAIAIAAVLALICVPATASATTFKGKSSQKKGVTLKARSSSKLVTSFGIRHQSVCELAGKTIRSRTRLVRGWEKRTRKGFYNSARFDSRQAGGITISSRLKARGKKVSKRRWKGSFRSSSIVRRNGQELDRCTTGLVRWTARAR